MVGNVLDDYGKKSVQVCFARPNAVAQPQSQNEWWRLVFRADSLWCEGRPAEAWKVYDVAFSVDKYILPSYLSTIAGRTEDPVKREALIRHRMKLECDYYDSITDSLPTDIKETFMQRANTYNYDLPMKKNWKEYWSKTNTSECYGGWQRMTTPKTACATTPCETIAGK